MNPQRYLPVCLPVLLPAVLLAGCATLRNGNTGNANTTPESLAKRAQTEAETPDQRKAYLEMIGKMQDQGAWFASLAHIDAFRQQYGDPPELRLLRARALMQTGQSAAAERAYRSLLAGRQAAAGWHGLGLLAAQQHQRSQAEQDLARAIQLEPLNAVFQSDLGFARLLNGDLDAARIPLATAAELAPDDIRNVANLALCTLLSGDAGKARAMMTQANLPEASRDSVYRMEQQLRGTDSHVAATVGPPSLSKSANEAHP